MSKTPTWFEIKPENAVKSATDIYLYDQIGGFGITAGAFVDALSGVKSKSINLFVNSPGGDVADGTAIFNALKRHSASVHAIIDGWAASAASFIVQAADEISMGVGSVMVIHDARGVAMGDPATMTEAAETLSLLSDNIAQIYAERAGGSAEEWRALMKSETWYKAQEAVDAKLADSLVASSKPTNLIAPNPSNFRKIPEWIEMAVAISTVPSDARIDGIKAELRRTEHAHEEITGGNDVASRLRAEITDFRVSGRAFSGKPPATDDELRQRAVAALKIPSADKRRVLTYMNAQAR